MTESSACMWLGREVVVISDGEQPCAGRLTHVSSRRAFIVQAGGSDAGQVRSLDLARLIAIEARHPDARRGGA